MLIVTTLYIQYAVLSIRVVVTRLSYGAWIDKDCPFLITVGCIIGCKEMLNIMRNVRVSADNIIIFSKTLIIHFINTELAPIRIINIAVHEQNAFTTYLLFFHTLMIHTLIKILT